MLYNKGVGKYGRGESDFKSHVYTVKISKLTPKEESALTFLLQQPMSNIAPVINVKGVSDIFTHAYTRACFGGFKILNLNIWGGGRSEK